MGLEYRLVPVIVDHAPADGGEPVTVAVSGAILQYLAEKPGQFIGAIPGDRGEVMQWLFWQMGGLGQTMALPRLRPDHRPRV
jgi:GST-like protein